MNETPLLLSLLLLPLAPVMGCSGSGSSGATGGQDSADSSTGGADSGGISSGGSTLSSGGSTSGGSGGSTSGGASTGGAAASAGVPSAGCGQGGRPADGAAEGTNYIIDFPESYDGSTPMRMLLGLHANGNPITQIQSLTNGSRLAESFVRVFPKSQGAGWDHTTDKPRIDAVLADVQEKYCVDQSRFYLTGHSSGAGMSVQMLCNGDSRFAGVAPVAAWKSCNEVDPIPTMYIQGFADAQRGGGDGKDVVDVFASSNSCGATTVAFDAVAGCTGYGNKAVDPGCVSYGACGEPLIWCSHNDEGYNLTDGHYHGWPCFASNAMADFFLSLP